MGFLRAGGSRGVGTSGTLWKLREPWGVGNLGFPTPLESASLKNPITQAPYVLTGLGLRVEACRRQMLRFSFWVHGNPKP